MKTLNQYALGEIITKEDCERYFGKEFMDIFNGKIKLVAVTFTIQDEDETQMDCELKHKDYYEKTEEEKK